MSATGAIESRLKTCETHGIEYAQILVFKERSAPDVWTGQCWKCEDEDKLLARARQILPARRSEIDRRMSQRMPKVEKQILKESKEQLEDWLENLRREYAPQYEAYVREQYYSQELSGVENEIVAEEVERLRQSAPKGA